jgi:putative SOS response-associated peptidase YedK
VVVGTRVIIDELRVPAAVYIILRDRAKTTQNPSKATSWGINSPSLNRHTFELAQLRWAWFPFWSKGGKALFSSINARAEILEASADYREAFQKRRCRVPDA